jgi:hypothetical protein
MANPHLGDQERSAIVRRLMTARRAVRDSKAKEDRIAEAAAHRMVDEAKRGLRARAGVVVRRSTRLHPAHGQE